MLPTNRPVDGVSVKGVNEWAKFGDKGLPQPDGFTPPGNNPTLVSLTPPSPT